MKANFTLALFLLMAACNNGPKAAEQTKAAPTSPAVEPAKAAQPSPDGSIAIMVDGEGYHPSTVTAPAGKKTTLVFTRTTDKSCGTEVVFPSLNIKLALPLNQPTPVEIDMPASGQIAFACGMDMLKGSIVAQ